MTDHTAPTATPSQAQPAPRSKPAFLVIGTGIGMAFGTGLGVAYGNLALGMSLGIWLGLMFSSALMASHAEQAAHFVICQDSTPEPPPHER